MVNSHADHLNTDSPNFSQPFHKIQVKYVAKHSVIHEKLTSKQKFPLPKWPTGRERNSLGGGGVKKHAQNTKIDGYKVKYISR